MPHFLVCQESNTLVPGFVLYPGDAVLERTVTAHCREQILLKGSMTTILIFSHCAAMCKTEWYFFAAELLLASEAEMVLCLGLKNWSNPSCTRVLQTKEYLTSTDMLEWCVFKLLVQIIRQHGRISFVTLLQRISQKQASQIMFAVSLDLLSQMLQPVKLKEMYVPVSVWAFQ